MVNFGDSFVWRTYELVFRGRVVISLLLKFYWCVGLHSLCDIFDKSTFKQTSGQKSKLASSVGTWYSINRSDHCDSRIFNIYVVHVQPNGPTDK